MVREHAGQPGGPKDLTRQPGQIEDASIGEGEADDALLDRAREGDGLQHRQLFVHVPVVAIDVGVVEHPMEAGAIGVGELARGLHLDVDAFDLHRPEVEEGQAVAIDAETDPVLGEGCGAAEWDADSAVVLDGDRIDHLQADRHAAHAARDAIGTDVLDEGRREVLSHFGGDDLAPSPERGDEPVDRGAAHAVTSSSGSGSGAAAPNWRWYSRS